MPFLLLLLLALACLRDNWSLPWLDELGLGRGSFALLTWSAMAFMVVAAAQLARRPLGQLLGSFPNREEIYSRFRRSRYRHLLALVVIYGLALYVLGWGWTVRILGPAISKDDFIKKFAKNQETVLTVDDLPSELAKSPAIAKLENKNAKLDDSQVEELLAESPYTQMFPGAELLILAPFLVALVASWACFYEGEKIFHDTAAPAIALTPFWSRRAYLLFHLRHHLALIFVVIGLLVIQKELSRLSDFQESIWFKYALLGLMVAVLAFFPWVLRIVLGLKPLPAGPLRERLMAAAHRLRFRFSNILLWNTNGAVANAILRGTYAFGGSSIQNAAGGGGGKFGVVGEIAFNGLGGVTGGSEDFNQNGILDGSAANTTWPANPISIANNGNYSISNNGRGTLSITFAGGRTSHSVLYVVSSSEALFMTSDPQTAGTIIAGEAFQQSTGGFSGTSLSGSYVGYSSALGSTAGTTAVNLFLVNASNGNITGTASQEDGNNFSSSSITGMYTVATNGRTVTAPTGGHPLLLYLVNSTRAFFLGSNGRVESGLVESQTGSSANGTYAFGTPDPQDKSASDDSGVAVFASPNLSVTEDDNSNGSQTPGGMHSFTYSIDSTGLGQVPSGCTISATFTTCQTIFYVISSTKVVIMDVGSTTPNVRVADHQ